MKSTKYKTKWMGVVLTALLVASFLPATVEANHVDVSMATDKACYNIGSAVKFTFANNGPAIITFTDGLPWDAKDATNNLVYSPMRDNTITDVDAGDALSWSWNQRSSKGAQVAAGSYKIAIPKNRFSPNDGADLESSFSIGADADEDCIGDTTDSCPYDATNACAASNIGNGNPGGHNIIPPIGGVVCIAGLPCEDPDGDDMVNDYDLCDYNSGPKWNEGCPDYNYKKEVIRTEKANMAGAAALSLVSAPINLLPVVGTGIWAAVLIGEAAVTVYTVVDGLLKIKNDPPDPNYKELAEMKYRQAILLPEDSEINQVTNNLIVASLNFNAAANAFVHSNERFMGAEAAKDYEWMQKQAELTKFYALKSAQTLKEFNFAITDFELMLAKYGANVPVTKDILQQKQGELKSKGIANVWPYEVEFARNNLFATDAEIQALSDNILSLDPVTWRDEPISEKIEKMKAANNKFIIALENRAAEVGANVNFVKDTTPSTGFDKYNLKISNAPNNARLALIWLNIANYVPISVTQGDLPASVTKLDFGMGWTLLFVRSSEGIPQGTSGTLANIEVPINSAKPKVAGLSFDMAGWIVAQRQETIAKPDATKLVPVYAAPRSAPYYQVFKNGAWALVANPAILPPSGSALGTSWWDGSAWITSPPPQYGVVWIGTGWSGTGPGTMPPKGMMYIDETTLAGKINVWDGYQYVLADKATVDAAPRPSAWPVFDVGTMAWTFTSQMPPMSS